MSGSVRIDGKSVSFADGETVAHALQRARTGGDIAGSARASRVFCGIGQCQNCLVRIAGGGIAEACLTPCRDGMELHTIATEPDVAGRGGHD